ncbi:hypothetical protein E2C01_093633 [Portunus trituberculatus]|uniref:XLF-like N-terminal domain-containing protein n=1 Tax=Portunus trituberculatus TaxID=210409 RepID=A0A5B7JJN3_PORTR|nr:hypothetical protein [Portunus trituberculatus]
MEELRSGSRESRRARGTVSRGQCRILHLNIWQFSSEQSLVSWRPVEEAKWRAVPKLGPEWMCKWSVDERGYWVVLTDGCALWGEARSASSIQDKAEEWASCIEAEVQKLSSLVLQDLGQMSVKAHWQGREQVVLHVSSTLMDLAYRWEFDMKRLCDELVC